MDDFRTYYDLGTLNFDDLEFEKACNSDAVRGILGTLGEHWASNSITTAGFGAILRVAEGIDSIHNLANSGTNLPTEVERGAAILCGLSQLGGLLFSILSIIVGMTLCICAPLGSAIALFVYRILTRQEELFAKRDEKIDNLLGNSKLLEELQENSGNKQRMHAESESLLPLPSYRQ